MDEPMVKKIPKENDMFSVKFAGNKVVKVQRQFLNLLDESQAGDQEKRRIELHELNRMSNRCYRKQRGF